MTRYQIGELARMTGLTVRTIRFYSDQGLIPPTSRTVGGYRTYDGEAVAKLKLVRTLRDLGVDLPTAGRILAREVSMTDVARTHADAIDAQMRTLRLRRAVLRAVAKGGEMELMNELARMSDEERQRILDDFFEEVFGPLRAGPAVRAAHAFRAGRTAGRPVDRAVGSVGRAREARAGPGLPRVGQADVPAARGTAQGGCGHGSAGRGPDGGVQLRDRPGARGHRRRYRARSPPRRARSWTA